MTAITARLRSIDIIRGAVMVLMALDHVRVFAAVPPGGDTPGVFFTRWITNFCAPAFVFLAGTGAFLHGQRLPGKGELSKYLMVRGALLIFFEMTISRLGWTFNLDFYNYTEANVIWAIGWSMIIMAALVHLPMKAIAAFALVIIFGHNLTDFAHDRLSEAAAASPIAHFWQLLYFGGEFRWFDTGPKLVVLYSIIPWVAVMAAGYAFGQVMTADDARRRRLCLRIGLGATALFLLLRTFNIYGNPWGWSGEEGFLPGLLGFLGTAKYPASLQFLLMTLGPTIAIIPLLERAEGWLSAALVTFGRVPLFFYLLHIPFIHAVTVLISLVRTPTSTWWLFENHPLRIPPAPEGYMYCLSLLYLVTLLVVIALYFPCRWYGGLKARHPEAWYRYI